MDLPNRKIMRLKDYDYSSNGLYFITICTAGRKMLLGSISETDIFSPPVVKLSSYGQVTENLLIKFSAFYDDISICKFTIMPNHLHLIVHLKDCTGGPSGRPVPTNAKLGHFIGTFKRFCNRECGIDLWQKRSYDHIIRDEADYLKICAYMDNNSAKWVEDKYYTKH